MGDGPRFSETTVPAHEDWVGAVRFFPDGERLLSAASSGEMKLWDFRQANFWGPQRITCVQAFERPVGNYRDIVFSPDGRLVIVYGNNWTQVWNASAGRWFLDLYGEDEEFKVLARGGRLMVTEAQWRHGGMRVWDMEHGRPLATLKLSPGKISPRYHPAMEDMTEEEIDMHTPSARIKGVAEAGRDKLLVSTENHETFVFDLNSFEMERVIPDNVMAVHPDGHTAFSSSAFPCLVAFDLFDDRVERVRLEKAIGEDGRGKLVFLPDGRMVTTNGNAIRVWREGTWDCLLTIEDAHDLPEKPEPWERAIGWVVVLADGKRVATASGVDPRPRVWDLESGESVVMKAENDNGPGVQHLAAHPLGLVGGTPAGLCLWDAETGDVLTALECPCRALDVAPDGRIACAAGKDLVLLVLEG